MAKKIFSAELTETVLEAFSEHVTERRYVKYRAVEAGMKLFMALPSEMQVTSMQEDVSAEELRLLLVADGKQESNDTVDAIVEAKIKKMLPELTKSILSEIKGYNIMDEALKDVVEDLADNRHHNAG